MSPYYRGERLLGFGETVDIGDELPSTKVEVSDDNLALAKTQGGRGVFVGSAKLVLNGPDRYWLWVTVPKFVLKREIVLNQESVSTVKSHPQIVWRKK